MDNTSVLAEIREVIALGDDATALATVCRILARQISNDDDANAHWLIIDKGNESGLALAVNARTAGLMFAQQAIELEMEKA